MKTYLALLAVAAFTSVVGYVLYNLGVGDHHTNIAWAAATSVAFLITLLIDVWLFFAVAGEDVYRWDV